MTLWVGTLGGGHGKEEGEDFLDVSMWRDEVCPLNEVNVGFREEAEVSNS
jgi:hypothetical protein